MNVQTSRAGAGGKKTTSTPMETTTDVDLTGSPQQRPAPGGPLESSQSSQGLPTPTKCGTKSHTEPKHGPNDGGTSVPAGVASG